MLPNTNDNHHTVGVYRYKRRAASSQEQLSCIPVLSCVALSLASVDTHPRMLFTREYAIIVTLKSEEVQPTPSNQRPKINQHMYGTTESQANPSGICVVGITRIPVAYAILTRRRFDPEGRFSDSNVRDPPPRSCDWGRAG